MFRLEFLFILQIVTGVILVVLLRKMVQMKKQVDTIIEEVKNYIQFITDEEQEETQKKEVVQSPTFVKSKKEDKDEVHTKLIQAVLGEYFL